MRIAQVSPLHERVPPVAYGGTERVVHWLTEELVRRGHDVTLFASGDSETSATLVPGAPRGLRLDTSIRDALPWHFAMIDDVCTRAEEFDVVHFHTEYLHLALAARTSIPNVTTLHGRLDLPDTLPYFRRFPQLAYVSISDNQREPLPDLAWTATVHHGLPLDLLAPSDAPGSYLAFLGRLSPEKGFEAACAIAERAGMPLLVAGKMDRADEAYIRERCKPLLARPDVEYLGEINGRPKNDLLAGAHALLFPIDWPEPFGLVMIEAMACGTPVIAFRRGSVPEVVDDGVTGFVVETIDEAVAAVAAAPALDRRRIRAVFAERFSVERMTDDYLAVYRDLCARGALHARAHRAALRASWP